MRGGYRTKIFLATFSIAATVLLIAASVVALSLRRQTYQRIERSLIGEARLAAELLSHRAAAGSTAELQDEARTLGRDIDARVTLIAEDGHVVGDSSQDAAGLAQLENHGSRPEVVDARQRGIGIASRFSATLGINMLYVAATVKHPSIATVRLALPLTEIDRQLQTIWTAAFFALAVSAVGAFALAWVASSLLVRRLNRLATGARRYLTGDETPPVDYDDDEIGTVSRVLDEAVRRLGNRAADLHRADQVRRDFVANVSHELRTPLTAIRGYVEALTEEPVDPEQRRRFLEIIARHTARMERLSKDLLRLARIEAGQEPPEYSTCSIRDLFETVVEDLEPDIERKRQRVDIAVDPTVGRIVADPLQLHDALRNLVENAVIYSPAGGLITLGARRDHESVSITVADQGPGIPPADLARVFERFYRVDKARSHESGGTGLGLAIVKHIVEHMEGSVRVDNRPGGGAIFTILLPAERAARAG